MKRKKLLKAIALALTVSSCLVIVPSTRANAEIWKNLNGNWYYLDNSGKIKTGWILDGGYWYYLDSNGVMKTGWLQDGGNWYYLWSSGQLAVNTTIQGYTADANGVCTLANRGAFTWKDAEGGDSFRTDISQRQQDIDETNKLTMFNIDLSGGHDRYSMGNLVMNLSDGHLTLSQAKSQCVGKVVGGKYLITDIKYFGQVFKMTDLVENIKSSSLYDYKSDSKYTYDECIVYSCFNERSFEWEAMRVVVEFEAI